jgi:hypothetical protein
MTLVNLEVASLTPNKFWLNISFGHSTTEIRLLDFGFTDSVGEEGRARTRTKSNCCSQFEKHHKITNYQATTNEHHDPPVIYHLPYPRRHGIVWISLSSDDSLSFGSFRRFDSFP